MDYSQLISERQWNPPDKGERESNRENDFIDDIVQKAHIEREVLANLKGIETVFDGGAGSGRFSILLAKQGVRVVHFDISRAMITKAKELARVADVEKNITFVLGALEDLSMYRDKAFDMVISFDAPISYTFPNQEKVIAELVRIASKKILISVSSRLGSLPYRANPYNKNQFILDPDTSDGWIQWNLRNSGQLLDAFEFDYRSSEQTLLSGLFGSGEAEIEEYKRGGTPWPITYLFMPDELKSILERCGVKKVELAGPGAYARTVPQEVLVKIMRNPKQRKDFLDFCYLFDQYQFVCGMGKDNLLAKGQLSD
jgi:SAM-dependent methyltransferase